MYNVFAVFDFRFTGDVFCSAADIDVHIHVYSARHDDSRRAVDCKVVFVKVGCVCVRDNVCNDVHFHKFFADCSDHYVNIDFRAVFGIADFAKFDFYVDLACVVNTDVNFNDYAALFVCICGDFCADVVDFNQIGRASCRERV